MTRRAGLDSWLAVDLAIQNPLNHGYKPTRDDRDAFNDFFYHVSYLYKAETKHFGDGIHSFGTCRI